MKLVGTVVLLSFLIAVPSSAAERGRVGLSAGPSLAYLVDTSSSAETVSFEAGLEYGLDVGGRSSLRSGVLVRAFRTSAPCGICFENLYRTTYVSVPLELEYRRYDQGSLSPTIGIGVSVDALVRAQNVRIDIGEERTMNIDQELEGWDWSLVGSAGISSPSASWQFRVRGSLGMRSVWRDGYDGRNRAVALAVTRWIST